MARALALLGSERAWVVHGADGMDEISTLGYTKVSECRDGFVRTFYVHPSDFGLPKADLGRWPAATRRPTRRIIDGVLDGEPRAGARHRPAQRGRGLFVAGRRGVGPRRDRAGGRGHRRRSRAATRSTRWSRLVARRARRMSGAARRPTCCWPSSRRRPAHGGCTRAQPDAARRGRTRERIARPRATLFEQRSRAPGGSTSSPSASGARRRQGVLRADYDPAAIAAGYAAGRRRRHLRPDRADVLRRRARAPRAVRAAVAVPAAAQGLHRRRYQLLEARAAGADAVLLIVGGADAGHAASACSRRPAALGLARSSRCTTRTSSSVAAGRPARASSA